MSVLYCIPTLNQLDWVLEKHVPSINTELIQGFMLHTSECLDVSETTRKINSAKLPQGIPIRWTYSEQNIGVSAAWNFFLRGAFEDNKYSALIVANDDIILGKTTLEGMLEAAEQNPKALISAVQEGKDDNAFSLFYMPESVYRTVGFFDEQFYPAYFEDNDYSYRMKLLDVPLVKAAGDTYYHKGSATINTYTPERMNMHHHQFRINEQKYIAKWGGKPGEEKSLHD